MIKDLSVSRLLDVYGCFLSEKQRTLALCYYDEDLSLAEIAENEGVSRQAVCDMLRRVCNQLSDWEKECGYFEKFKQLRALKNKAVSGDKSAINNIFEKIDEL